MIERIVVPLDGSMTAEAILPQVRRILYRKDVELVLVRAVEPPMVENAMVLAEETLAAAREHVLGQAEKLQQQGVRVRTIVRFGYPASVILDAVESERATMIALATHGASGLKRLLFGSVAEEVIRRSPVPVLLVRPFWSYEVVPPGNPEFRPIRNVLFPVDGSGRARAALPGLIEFASLFEARIVLLRVLETSVTEAPEFAAADREMSDLAAAFENAGVRTLRILARGKPVERILQTVAQSDIDVIAMATRGRRGLTRVRKGSITEEVLRRAEVPILVTRVAAAVREGRKLVARKV